ncbi:hypothetical protein RJI07_04845 [Mycoplasmatota bacterium WC30]
MKKTLITILLTILMSAGIFFSAGSVSVSAAVLPLGYEVDKENTTGTFTTDFDNIELAIIEYTYYSNEILMSELIEVDLVPESCEIGTDNILYSFVLPEEALSFKIWRVVTDSDLIKSLSGSFEYINSPETSVSAVETRIRKIYINDDLITKEYAPISYGGILSHSYTFKMHFNVEDKLGNKVPIDRIHSLNVEYDVITTVLLIEDINHVEKNIVATEDRNMSVWPFIIPASVHTYINESIDSNYDWMVELANLADADGPLPTNTVSIDQTSILTISYYYEGVFFEEIDVVDEPYDSGDIIDVIPGTTTPLPGWLDLLSNIDDMAKWIQIVIYVGIGIFVILLITLVLRIFSIIQFIGKGLILVFKAAGKIVKFIVIEIPKGIMKFIIFLVVPSERRKERNRNVSRYL